jgi:hypothetical protein
MALYHFSEDPRITSFEPRVAPSSARRGEHLVWAIDEQRQVMYFFPRDCPRACFWPGEHTTDADRARFCAGVESRMVIAIEAVWLDRIRSAALYRYTMPEESFEPGDESAGHWVSRETVTPLAVEPIDDLLGAIVAEGGELRIMTSLIALWRDVFSSTLQFSGTRLRNARGYDEVDWSAVPLGPGARSVH